MLKSTMAKSFKIGALAFMLSISSIGFSQILYTDITDTTVSTNNGYYDIDLNQDGVDDFRIAQFVDTGATSTTNAVLISPFDPIWGNTAGEVKGSFNYPYNLNIGEVLNYSTNWNGIGGFYITGYMTFEVDSIPYPDHHWLGPVTDGFIGLRVAVNNTTHYGWARLDIAADNRSFTIKDFAYEQTADESVIVGELFLSQDEYNINNIIIAQSKEIITISLKENKSTSVSLSDLNGRTLKTDNFSDRLEIYTADLPAGIYILNIQQEGRVRNEKVLIQ